MNNNTCNINGQYPCAMCPDQKLPYFINEAENNSKPSGLFTKNCSINGMFTCTPNMMY